MIQNRSKGCSIYFIQFRVRHNRTHNEFAVEWRRYTLEKVWGQRRHGLAAHRTTADTARPASVFTRAGGPAPTRRAAILPENSQPFMYIGHGITYAKCKKWDIQQFARVSFATWVQHTSSVLSIQNNSGAQSMLTSRSCGTSSVTQSSQRSKHLEQCLSKHVVMTSLILAKIKYAKYLQPLKRQRGLSLCSTTLIEKWAQGPDYPL